MSALRTLARNVATRWGPLRRACRRIKPVPLGKDEFLAGCRSVIHVGANDGAERFLYESAGVGVVWIEPIPEVFDRLQKNIRGFRNQQARRALAAEVSGRTVTFKISNNEGASSSIFDFAGHSEIWPEVRFYRDVQLETVTLDELLADVLGVDALILDTQGSELLVLQGAERLIQSCRFIKAEAADFNCYDGGCTLDDLDAFLGPRGFVEIARHEFAAGTVGRCFDVIWKRSPGGAGSKA